MDYAATILSKLPGALKRDHGMRHLVDTLQEYLPQYQIDVIVRAYEFGAAAHEGQTRKTGEPYISHPVAVAQSLAEMYLDSEAIMAAILHDTVEDTDATLEQIEEKFGHEVALLAASSSSSSPTACTT
jgi:(p)ppGpp synthase/HD superfamily hydrolase